MNRNEYLISILEQHRRREIDEKQVAANLKSLLMSENNGKLYRYRSFKSEYSLQEVEDEYIYCSKPSKFNDPFDCKMGFDIQELMDAGALHMLSHGNVGPIKTEEVATQELLKFVDVEALKRALEDTDGSTEAFMKIMKGCKGEISDWLIALTSDLPGVDKNYIAKSVEALFETLDPQKTFITPEGDLLLLESLEASMNLDLDADRISKISTLSKYMDPELGKNADDFVAVFDDFFAEYEKKIDDCFGVSCLTTDNKNKLMWAHYAYNHEGFCIEYDLANVDWGENQLFLLPVIYSAERPLMPIREMFEAWERGVAEEQINKKMVYDVIKTLGIKGTDWSYENEWRMLTPGNIKNKERSFPFISCLYLGARCSKENREKLIAIANRLNIPVKKMVVDRQTFDLHVADLDF